MACDASRILSMLQARAVDTRDKDVLGGTVVEALDAELEQATWVGIYWLRGPMLVLGPYVGPETEHTRIPIGTGVCGQAVADDADRVVDDVRDEENYLACAAGVRSEMVVLLRARGEIIGQIDLDADSVGAFDGDDYCVVRAVADALAGLVEVEPYDPDAE